MLNLTDEQQRFVNLAKEGKNVLADACIGSGKTTTIQNVCGELAGKQILYLTYNRRLLQEARARIRMSNVDIHTFHSFAGTSLTYSGIVCDSEREAPRVFAERVRTLPLYDTVIVDEYQDLESDLADMLWHICRVSWSMRPGFLPQFLVVGDMDQKIYDYTSFDAGRFIDSFMNRLGGYERVYFTRCFRLQPRLAAELGQAWGKSIMGVNPDCRVSEEHNLGRLVSFLAKFKPEEILVLGGNNGVRAKIQNMLESGYPNKFNKHTVYSSVVHNDSDIANADTSKTAIFTTYDSAKGLERPVCVVCDFTEKYLESRMKYSVRRDILKNLFLVAASRGKNFVVFYTPPWANQLKFKDVGDLSGPVPVDMRPEDMSTAFDYRRFEDVDECIAYLSYEKVRDAGDEIGTTRSSGMIDLSPCVGVYAKAAFFKNYNIDVVVAREEVRAKNADNVLRLPAYDKKWSLQKKILYLTSLTTSQERYFTQIKKSYVTKKSAALLAKRLSEVFDAYEPVEAACSVVFDARMQGGSVGSKMLAGHCDVLKDGDLYELKFVTDLKEEHMLQAALYMVALGKPEVFLWNLFNGEMYRVEVSDREGFLKAVCKCVSKGMLDAVTARLPNAHSGFRALAL